MASSTSTSTSISTSITSASPPTPASGSPSASPSTRDRILDAARVRFVERGYDATSLREIAEDLGVTKAALYYHFQSKEQLLRALIEPVGGVANRFLERLSDAADIEQWASLITWVIDEMAVHVDLFRLLARNRVVAEAMLEDSELMGEHTMMHERLREALQASGAPLAQRVRMVATLGAVTGFDDWAPDLLLGGDLDEVLAELKRVAREILGVPAAVGALGTDPDAAPVGGA